MASKASSIQLFSFNTPQMRAFHLTWVAFFVCFFAWFACAPLMPVIKGEFGLSVEQIANINIAAVAITILVRLVVGPMCDRYGPRKTYTGLLALGAIPVLGVALAQSYESFLLFRLGIGAVGASFVITQYHTSVMFAPKVVGTANATAAGWGNAGGGAAQALMPLLLGALVMAGVSETLGWRVALVVPGLAMLVMAWVYWRHTQDCPAGNYSDLRAAGLPVEGGGRAAGRAFAPPAATTAPGCCSSPTAPASASRSSSITSPPSITSSISACRSARPGWRPAASACWRCLPAPWAAGCRTGAPHAAA